MEMPGWALTEPVTVTLIHCDTDADLLIYLIQRVRHGGSFTLATDAGAFRVNGQPLTGTSVEIADLCGLIDEYHGVDLNGPNGPEALLGVARRQEPYES